MKCVVRPATCVDLDGIMNVEKASFHDGVSPLAMAERTLMERRIKLHEEMEFTEGFPVAIADGVVVGYAIFFPTHMTPEECTSWAHATDNGNLRTMFNINGRNIYAASLAVMSGAPAATAETLVLWSQICTAKHRARTGCDNGFFMFCARMPGFRKAFERTGISAQDYWRKTGKLDIPYDPLLRHFTELLGDTPYKLLENGYPPDSESGGHGVLFAVRDSFHAQTTLAVRIWNILNNKGVR